jgi:hypothetical protein
MKKHLLSVAMGAMLAAGATAVVCVRGTLADLVATVRHRWNDPFDKLQCFAPLVPVAAQQPHTLLAVSKTWLARLAQRLRPTVTNRWRLCASA